MGLVAVSLGGLGGFVGGLVGWCCWCSRCQEGMGAMHYTRGQWGPLSYSIYAAMFCDASDGRDENVNCCTLCMVGWHQGI